MDVPRDVSLEVTAPAEPGRLPLLRSTLSVMLDGAGLGADTVTDLTVMADAIGELVVSCSPRGATVTYAVTTRELSTDVTIVGQLADQLSLPTDGLAWRLVEATTDEASVTTGDDGRVQVACRARHMPPQAAAAPGNP
ncbi:hypothetical protein GTV32_18735 [Gordonia sp. SID5947]|uniref:hypothetical protein n=1 Tax=Gordonia sp. SID5947 TaxID=2690315 RepID=UPI00136A8E46|nr:hypothetical protein [Gordonia sp. SID5947]MYR08205.1 hypothetical protein [Gordonia sp. SID5947]